MNRVKKVMVFAMAFCFMLTVAVVSSVNMQAIAATTLLNTSGSVEPDQKVRHEFNVSKLSNVSIVFSNCSGGEYEFEIVNTDTGREAYEASGYASTTEKSYSVELAAGNYVLVIHEDDDIRFNYSVTINGEEKLQVGVKSIKLNKTSLTLGIGQDYRLKATVTPSNTTAGEIVWSSSNQRVASVDDDGEIEGEATGKAVITAKLDGKSAKCTVYVSRSYIEINKGKSRSISSEFKYVDNYKKGKWSSSNSSVVRVDKKGKIKGLKQGNAKIRLKVGKKTYSTTVYVYDKGKLKSAALKKLKSLLRRPDSLIVDRITYSGTLKVRIDFRSSGDDYDNDDYDDDDYDNNDDDDDYDDDDDDDDDDDYDDDDNDKGVFVGYYDKGKFRYSISD